MVLVLAPLWIDPFINQQEKVAGSGGGGEYGERPLFLGLHAAVSLAYAGEAIPIDKVRKTSGIAK